MSDYGNVIGGMFNTQPQANVAANIDVDPDQSARAYELSKATGVPASIIGGDLDSFERNSKATIANHVVSNNTYIQDYVQSHPLASSISNDDYGNLDKVSEGLADLKQSPGFRNGMWSSLFDASKAVAHSYASVFQNSGQNLSDDEIKNHKVRASLAASIDTAVALGQTTLNLPFTFSEGYATSRLGPDAGENVHNFLDGVMMGAIGTHIPETIGDWHKALPYLREGEVPPAGIHPAIDQVKTKLNQTALDLLDQKVTDAQTSLTRERAPELFRDFVNQHVEDTNMQVSGPAVAALYGDKIPDAEDGLLGWVPNLKEQLDVTKETGADITVPMADWISKVDPQVHQALHDDLRVVPEGITNREAQDLAAAPPPKPMIDETIPVVRGANGYEPLFSIGDRKLELKRMVNEGGAFGPEQGFHDFDLVNEDSQSVGTVNLSEQKGGKDLYVEMVNGLGEYYNPNNFGPALMRSLLRQIKTEFPGAEYITGHRVSGAREAAGTITAPSAIPRIKLMESDADPRIVHKQFSDLVGGAWLETYPGVEAYVKPTELYTAKEADITAAVDAELNRLLPKRSFVSAPVAGIRSPTSSPEGFFQRYTQDRLPVIAYSLNSDSPIGVARHESIHALRSMGVFHPEEWNILEKAAESEGWLKTFNIHERYSKLPHDKQVEEAIAEGFRHWMAEKPLREGTPRTLVDQIFEKLENFLAAIKKAVGNVLGKEPTFEDLFSKIDSGEVAQRGGHPEAAGAPQMAEPPLEPGTGTEVVPPFRAAKEVGMTAADHKNYMKLIEARQKADLAASSRRVLAEQTKRQTTEWKANAEAMRPDVVRDINARPDVAADKFLANSELHGKKLDNSYKLDRESLTKEQLDKLPDEYITGKTGVKADDVAHLFGYQTGDQMIAGLARFNETRKASGLGRDRFMRQLVQMEISRRMEVEHGYLEKNILDEAKDQILSQNQLDILHEETHHLGLMAGGQAGQLTKDQLVGQIKAKFDTLPVRAIDSDKWLREAAKHGKNAESALLANKPADAFKSKQAQYYNTIYAQMAREVEKAKSKLDKAAKPFKKTGVKSIEPEYLNHIQNLLQTMGYKVGRSFENIQENLNRRQATLEEFADAKLSESYGLRDIPVADVIVDGKLGPVEGLTTHDFLGAKQTIDALIKNARDEQKIIRAGEAVDRADVLTDMKTHVERFPLKPMNATKTRWDKLKDLPKTFLASITNMETFLNRMGDRDPASVFNKYITYPGASAANRKSMLQREYARKYQTIGEIEDKDKLVAAPFNDPTTGQSFVRFTRGNVATMLQNAGNKSNWEVLAKGYGADPEKLMQWLIVNTRKGDWERAQKLGKDVFGELVKLADQEYEHIHGITIDKIPLEPISNIHGNFEGWYHPLIKHPDIEGKSPIRDGAYDDGDYGHITTSNGYTKKRSSSAYPLDLNPDMTPVRINQMIHDISFRSFVLETQKLFKDPGLSNTITGHYGAEYNGRNFLLPWLKAIAGQESIPSRAAAKGRQISEVLRQNVVSTYIGFNPFTAFKHGPTALVMSTKQVGAKNFLRAVQDLYARSPSLTQANHEFVMQWSEELQRRERHWQDTIFGTHSEIEGAKGVRENIIQSGSWLVAKSDMLSAKPTWLAAYRNGQEEGLSHGAAIDQADAKVRLAHGSTAVTNQPALVRGGGALHNWLTSVYGFFGTVMQRRIELAQGIHDTWGLAKQGEISSAAKNIPGIASDIMAYVVWPTLVEEWVTGLTTDDKRGWLEHATTAALLGLSSSVLYARDIVHGMLSGQDVGVGLISSPLHDVVKAAKDLGRKDSFTKARMGKTVGDTLTAFGHGTGMAPKTVDNAIRFGIDLVNQQAHPKTFGDLFRGVTKGTTKPRQEK